MKVIDGGNSLDVTLGELVCLCLPWEPWGDNVMTAALPSLLFKGQFVGVVLPVVISPLSDNKANAMHYLRLFSVNGWIFSYSVGASQSKE